MPVMTSGLSAATFLLLANTIGASPLGIQDNFRRDINPPCKECWTIAPQCSTYSPIPKLVSSMQNPPASETNFKATDFCSAFLQTVGYSISLVSSTAGTTTSTSTELFPWTSTITVSPSPTLSIYCPTPTSGMICGLSNQNFIDPVALNEDQSDMSPVTSPEDCYQRCLGNPACKSYFTSQWINETTWNCAIFRNTLKNNVAAPQPGSNFYDRGCPEYIPSQCNRTDASYFAPVAPTTKPPPPLYTGKYSIPLNWDPSSAPITQPLSTPTTIVQQVPSPTSRSTSYYFNPMTIAIEPPYFFPTATTRPTGSRSTVTVTLHQTPSSTTRLVSRRAPDDTTVFIDVTLQPSDFSTLITFFDTPTSTDVLTTDIVITTEFSTITLIPSTTEVPITVNEPVTLGPGKPKTTIQPSTTDVPIDVPISVNEPVTLGPGQPKTTIKPKTTTIYTTLNTPTTNRPPPTTIVTIFSTLNPTVCTNRANPAANPNRQPPPLTRFNHKGRAVEYTVAVPDCISQNPPTNNNNNNHYTSVINPATISFPQATSTRAGNSQPRPLTSFNRQARAVDGFVPNYSTSLPDYLKNWYVDYYGAIVPLACSCLITSPATETVISTTTTQYFSVYIASVVVLGHSPTPVTQFVTPYLTTAYLTVA